MKSENKARIDIRLSEADLVMLKEKADLAKLPLAAYGREILIRALDPVSREHEELVSRLVYLEERLTELTALIQSQNEAMLRLTMASLTSSALLRDDGKGTSEEAHKKILEHIAQSMKASPAILKIHRKDLN